MLARGRGQGYLDEWTLADPKGTDLDQRLDTLHLSRSPTTDCPPAIRALHVWNHFRHIVLTQHCPVLDSVH